MTISLPRQLARTERFTRGVPGQFTVAPDGATVLFLRSQAGDDPVSPAVGTANAEVTLWVAGLDGTRTQVRWDRDGYEYVPAAGWDAHGPYATVQSRDQRSLLLLGIDPADGATRVLAEQRDECWVQLVPGLPARLGSGALVSHADLRGTRYLTVDGAAVTPPGLQLLEVLGVDGEEVLFAASPPEDPTQASLWSYRAGEGARQLSTEPGVHTGARRGGTLLHVARSADRPAPGQACCGRGSQW